MQIFCATMNDNEEVFHAGERALQLRAGNDVRERMAAHGAKIIRDFMPEQHRKFFEQLPFVVVGSVDDEGQPWASILANPPGFIASPTAQLITVSALPGSADPLAKNLRRGVSLGLLGIEPHTRRRNRVNGVVVEKNPNNFTVRVQQSFGNCPKYIQAREAIYFAREPSTKVQRSLSLDAAAQQLIRMADTFFIASAHPTPTLENRAQGVDVSHRGGKVGFVRVENNVLTVPDFSGNSFFNTLGNLILNPRAGLLFIDFANGGLLYLAVRVKIIWRNPELEDFSGAERFLQMQVIETVYIYSALPLRWGAAQISPFLANTDTWY